MWRMQDGDRVLTEAEWQVFCTGLDLLRDDVENDILNETDDAESGVRVFDRLTPEQKLALLADVASALRDPAIPMPHLSAVNEGAIMAVLDSFRDMLRMEIDDDEPERTSLRQLLLTAVVDSKHLPEELPSVTSVVWDDWDFLNECIADRILWDTDFELGDAFLDLPPDAARKKLRLVGIDPDYFMEIPPEPSKKGLDAARKKLALLLGLPIRDDDGLFPFLDDLYHGLCVGPIYEKEIAVWEKHPWIQINAGGDVRWEVPYSTWQAELSGALPSVAFTLETDQVDAALALPDNVRIVPLKGQWAVQDELDSFWCTILENGWCDAETDGPPILLFPTEAAAKVAFCGASRMYAERKARYEAVSKRFGLEDEQDGLF